MNYWTMLNLIIFIIALISGFQHQTKRRLENGYQVYVVSDYYVNSISISYIQMKLLFDINIAFLHKNPFSTEPAHEI